MKKNDSMMVNQPIKIGLVGLGPICEKHIMAIKSVDGLLLDSVCDKDKEKLKKMAKFGSFKCYDSFRDMLKNEELSVVVICTPSGTHAQLAIEAANFKKNILCEKPMALLSKDAENMIKACEKNKVQLFIVKQNRFNPPIQRLKEALDRGRFGKIYLAQVSVLWNRDSDYYRKVPWRGTKSMDGGVLLNQAAHHLDMLIWLLGMPENVMAYTATLKHKIEVEDTAIALFSFKNGTLSTLQATTVTFLKNYEGSILLLGENGTAKIGGTCLNEIEKWDFKDFDNQDELIQKYSIVPPDVFGYGHIKVYENLLLALKANLKIAVDGYDAIRTIKLVEAIYKSAKSRKDVMV